MLESLRTQIDGLGTEVAIDSTDMPAWANGQSRSPGVMRRGYFSDPDAAWGRRSGVSTRKGGAFYGYKLHMAACAKTDLPLAWEVRPANNHDMKRLPAVLDRLLWKPETVALDKGYDYGPIYREYEQREVVPVISRRSTTKVDTKLIDRRGELWRRLYNRRQAVEREFGRLKELGLGSFRVRQLKRVQVHADLCVLSRLLLAL